MEERCSNFQGFAAPLTHHSILFIMRSRHFVLSALFALGFLSAAQAQNEQYRHTLSATAGLNAFQIIALADNFGDNQNAQNASITATGSYGLTYDYGFKNWFSLGGALSYNNLKASASQIDVVKEDGSTYSGPVDLKVSRTNIAIRPLFHYGNKGRIDMYSGLRIGVSVWGATIDAGAGLLPEDVIDSARGTGAAVGLQLIPFGLRGYLNEQLAIGFETGFGAPHYAAFQVSYRM